MAAVWYRARADLRRGLWGTVALVALIGLAGGATLAAFAGSIRTREALPEFLEYNRAPDAGVFVDPTIPPPEQRRLLEQVADLPLWEDASVVATALVTVRPQDREPLVMVGYVLLGGELPRRSSRPIVVAGTTPEITSPTGTMVNEAFADALGLTVGDTFDLRTVTAAQLEAAGSGQLTSDPNGTDLEMTVAGIERQPSDLRTNEDDEAGIVFATDSWSVTMTPAFWDALDGDVASYGAGVAGRLEDGVSSDDLAASLTPIAEDAFYVEPSDEDGTLIDAVRRAVDFEANALVLFALVLAVAGSTLVGQAIGRQVTLRLDDTEALSAAGFSHRQRMAVVLPRSVLVGLAGAAVAVAVAVAVSPLAPVGLARRAELDPGVALDVRAVAPGALLVVALVVLWSLAVAWPRTRATSDGGLLRRDRPSWLGARLAGIGAGVTVVAGVRLALERGRGHTSVPVVSTVLAGAGGVFIVVAVLTFSFSLDRLVDSPVLQGWTWDVGVGNYSQQASLDEGVAALDANPLVAGYVGQSVQSMRIDDVASNVVGLGPGDLTQGPPVIEGRVPVSPNEIAVGITTLSDLGKEIGETVVLSSDTGAESAEATIVGTVILPAVIDDSLTMGEGATMTLEGMRTAYGDQGESLVAQSLLVSFTDGVDTARAIDSLQAEFGESVATARAPSDVANLRRVQGLPLLLAATVGLLALGTLANMLVTSIRRRRSVLATFATLGFRPRQVATMVAWQATTLAVVSLAVGVPLGLAAGRTVWSLMMTSIGTSVAPVTPIAPLILLGVAVVLGANAIAALPARAAARTRPAVTLRSE